MASESERERGRRGWNIKNSAQEYENCCFFSKEKHNRGILLSRKLVLGYERSFFGCLWEIIIWSIELIRLAIKLNCVSFWIALFHLFSFFFFSSFRLKMIRLSMQSFCHRCSTCHRHIAIILRAIYKCQFWFSRSTKCFNSCKVKTLNKFKQMNWVNSHRNDWIVVKIETTIELMILFPFVLIIERFSLHNLVLYCTSNEQNYIYV